LFETILSRSLRILASQLAGLFTGAAIAGASGAAVAATGSTAAVTLHIDGCWEVVVWLKKVVIVKIELVWDMNLIVVV
jgi:hypothetical protein